MHTVMPTLTGKCEGEARVGDPALCNHHSEDGSRQELTIGEVGRLDFQYQKWDLALPYLLHEPKLIHMAI